MKKTDEKRGASNYINITVATATLLLTLVIVILSQVSNENTPLKVGDISPQRFVTPIDVEDKYATAQKVQEAENSVAPLYTFDDSITNEVLDELNNVIEKLNDARVKSMTAPLQDDTTGGTDTSLNGEEVGGAVLASGDLPSSMAKESGINVIAFTQEHQNVFNGFTYSQRRSFVENMEKIVSDIMEQGFKGDSETSVYVYARDELGKLNLEPEVSDLGYVIISGVIRPNLVIDEEATAQARAKKAEEVRPVMLKRYQKIVDENEPITEGIYMLLETLNLIKNETGRSQIPLFGMIGVTALVFAFVCAYTLTFHKKIVSQQKELMLLCTLYSLGVITAWLMSSLPYSFIPLSIIIMLMSLLLEAQLAVVFSVVLSIISAMLCKQDVSAYMYFVMSCMAASMVTKLSYARNKVMFAGLLLSAANALTLLVVVMLVEKTLTINALYNMAAAALCGILSVIIATGSLPLWEALFDVITPLKLMELINHDNQLLRRLTIETIGTYHHSLVVANLAESAAYEIGANASLARVGSYYHDIGKLHSPQYYSENQMGVNPHDMLAPEKSAEIILQHVTEGTKLANEYNVPRAIKDIIAQHHGTTLVKYFYIKAKNANPDAQVDEKLYQYDGPIPQFKEAALVMLADTVEAAARSMMADGKNSQELECLILKLTKDKLDTGQLNDSGLTIKDLELTRKAFIQVFNGMYHDRISYPEEADKPKTEAVAATAGEGIKPDAT